MQDSMYAIGAVIIVSNGPDINTVQLPAFYFSTDQAKNENDAELLGRNMVATLIRNRQDVTAFFVRAVRIPTTNHGTGIVEETTNTLHAQTTQRTRLPEGG